jgi:hypothetical protein
MPTAGITVSITLDHFRSIPFLTPETDYGMDGIRVTHPMLSR